MAKAPVEDPRLSKLSALCLVLPEATRQLRNSHASFHVRKKIFAYFLDNHHGDGIVSVCVRPLHGENKDWIASDPERFYWPAYIGVHGWMGLRLDTKRVDWQQVRDFVVGSYCVVAPKRLAAEVAKQES